MDGNRCEVYGGRVRPRIATPLDHFANAAALWFQGMWMAWLAVAACIMLIVVIIAIRRARDRAHARVPHYRRTESGPIPLARSRQDAPPRRSSRPV